ncbi:hypothetical protein ZYGR_0AD04530 [Zygosaccharomyces rouxii]|uniref:Uncharacterized protein n=1 Tax=Zygosaccharomyces rouxii TaxID=4956 RepID=A0A1Q3A6R6_ZYGRO|nr:hypothetical protein ZYGR_0AD04530 [Zygosaccharomyces rouxii]
MSNFFRDSSLGFKPRSNIFSKLRVKDNEASNENSNTQEGDSSLEDPFLNSNKEDITSPATTIINSDGGKFGHSLQLRSSTPNPSTTKAEKPGRGLLEEDDLEITEVRDVPISKEESGTSSGTPNSNQINAKTVNLSLPVLPASQQQRSERECDIDASSNDVLLEAFTNTQKICSNLKQELHKVQTENSKLKTQVQSYQSDKEKIMDRFAEYKKLLNSFSEKSKLLFEQKKKEDTQLKEFKENYDKLLKKVESYKDDIHGLKNNLSQLRFLKKDSDTELAKKVKEIEYLKRELDSCSGQLSEEKLKNSSLVQEFGKIRGELMVNLTQNLSQGQSQILEKIGILESNFIGAYHVDWNNFSESSISKLTECIGTLRTNISSEFKTSFGENNRSLVDYYQKSFIEFMGRFNQIDGYYDKLSTSIKEGTELQSAKFDAHTSSLFSELRRGKDESWELIKKWSNENENRLQIVQDKINSSNLNSFQLIKTTSEEYTAISGDIKDRLQKYQSESFEILQKHLQKLPGFFDEVREGHIKSKKWMEKLAQELSSYKESLTNSREYEANISGLQSQISSLQLQKSQALSSLGTKEAQYEDLCNSLISKETELARFKEIEKELHGKIENISSEVEQQKNKWLRLNEENITLKANSENKLVVQNELLKAFQSENNTLKQRTAQLEDVRQQYEKENSTRLDKIQRINEQLQKLNVEMVQLKAHELELEEENRNLKRLIEDNKMEFEDTTDDYKRLKQRVIVLESDKQDIVSEKLELQDQMEKMQAVVTGLKQKVSSLQKNEHDYSKQLEAQAAEMRQIPKQPKRPENQGNGRKEPAKRRIREHLAPMFKPQAPSLPPPLPSTQRQLKSNSKDKDEEADEFDLSSSLNDDLELTNPSPIKPVIAKRGDTKIRPPMGSRKKLLLLDEQDSTPSKHRWKKRRI